MSPHRCPPFLLGVSEDVKKQFDVLHRDHSLSHDEKRKKSDALAHKLLSGQNLEEYNKFKSMKEKQKKEHEEKVAKLSPEARAAYTQLQELHEQSEKILAGMSQKAREELKSLWKHHHGGFEGGHFGGRGGRSHH